VFLVLPNKVSTIPEVLFCMGRGGFLSFIIKFWLHNLVFHKPFRSKQKFK
jgi:hypothetical protein